MECLTPQMMKAKSFLSRVAELTDGALWRRIKVFPVPCFSAESSSNFLYRICVLLLDKSKPAEPYCRTHKSTMIRQKTLCIWLKFPSLISAFFVCVRLTSPLCKAPRTPAGESLMPRCDLLLYFSVWISPGFQSDSRRSEEEPACLNRCLQKGSSYCPPSPSTMSALCRFNFITPPPPFFCFVCRATSQSPS